MGGPSSGPGSGTSCGGPNCDNIEGDWNGSLRLVLHFHTLQFVIALNFIRVEMFISTSGKTSGKVLERLEHRII